MARKEFLAEIFPTVLWQMLAASIEEREFKDALKSGMYCHVTVIKTPGAVSRYGIVWNWKDKPFLFRAVMKAAGAEPDSIWEVRDLVETCEGHEYRHGDEYVIVQAHQILVAQRSFRTFMRSERNRRHEEFIAENRKRKLYRVTAVTSDHVGARPKSITICKVPASAAESFCGDAAEFLKRFVDQNTLNRVEVPKGASLTLFLQENKSEEIVKCLGVISA